MKPRRAPAWRTALVAGILATGAASIVILPPARSTSRVVGSLGPSPGAAAQQPIPGVAKGGSGPRKVATGGVQGADPVEAAACAAGRNGGATDVGVTASTIKLGATVVDSGIGASFLRDARYGMIAVKDAVNRRGGVCGRKLELVLKDDGWNYRVGGEHIRSLVEDSKVFALAVVPSSEGLKNVSDGGYLRKKGVPVVGSDGMLIHQYSDPYIWPVAASTISTMHIMAQQAYDAGARHFGIVYEHTYHFGLEGAYAFNAAVKRLTGSDIPGYSNPMTDPKCDERFCGIADEQASYGTEIQTFNNSCQTGVRCDFVALLLEPSTAINWMTSGAIAPADGFRMGGPQPLFTRAFAQECGARCHDLWLWTGYDPPIGGNLGRPAIAEYVDAVNSAGSSADSTNTFVEGAYVGMSMLVQALERTGPDLTRTNLIRVLDSMDFSIGLAPGLSWRAGNHFANTRMQAWSIQYKDRFSGWRDQRVAMNDPWVGMDIPK